MMTKIQYLLVCLTEECAEVQQRATKALRFGLTESQPNAPDGKHLMNSQRLADEIEDLEIIIELLRENGVIQHIPICEKGMTAVERFPSKVNKINNYYAYAMQCGSVVSDRSRRL